MRPGRGAGEATGRSTGDVPERVDEGVVGHEVLVRLHLGHAGVDLLQRRPRGVLDELHPGRRAGRDLQQAVDLVLVLAEDVEHALPAAGHEP